MKNVRNETRSDSIVSGILSCNHIVIHLYPFVNSFCEKIFEQYMNSFGARKKGREREIGYVICGRNTI